MQDADLEYDPSNIPSCSSPSSRQGRRRLRLAIHGRQAHRVALLLAHGGNKFLTLLSNMFTNLNLTDMEICYKVFRREPWRIHDRGEPIRLRAGNHRQGSQLRPVIYEVGISYYGRTTPRARRLAGGTAFARSGRS